MRAHIWKPMLRVTVFTLCFFASTVPITAQTISSLSPSSGAVGALVTIAGSGFGATQGTSTVTFNGTTATPTSWSTDTIEVSVPSGATPGNVVITVSGAASNAAGFTVVPAPSITSLSVTSGVVGTTVTITGANFGAIQDTGTVSFNAKQATPTSWSSTTIVVTVPADAMTGNVVVSASGVASNGINFTVVEGLGVTSLSPTSGPVGTEVVISGAGFGAAQGSSTISLNGTNAVVAIWSDTSIAALVPAGASSGPFSVTVSGNVASSATFTITALPPGWSDGDIGSVGLAGSAVYTNGTFTVNGSGSGIAGTADVMHFVYQPLSGDGSIVARVVSSSRGQAAAMIRETLNANAADAYEFYGSSYFNFYDRPSTGASVVSQSDAYQPLPSWMRVVRSGNTFSAYASPDGVNWTQVGSTQTITMAQSVYIGLAVSSQNNSVLATATFDSVSINSAANPAPAITSVSPTAAAIGSQTTISGSGFGSTQSGSLVMLNGIPLTINSWSATSINITIPPGASSGPILVSVAPGMNDSNPYPFLVGSQPLSSWLDVDVGSVGLAGSASYSNGVFTVSGSGTGISSTADAMNFLYLPFSGDGTIVARVVSLQGSRVEAGLMIRETLNANSTLGCGCENGYGYFYYRATTGANVSDVGDVVVPSLPYWVKLVRAGNTFSAYLSANGLFWTQLESSETITMASNVFAGLVVSSQSKSSLATATFDNVSISQASSPAPVITGLSDTTGSVGSLIVISGSGFGASQGNSVAMLNGTSLPVSSWSDTAITVTIPTGATTGPLVVSVAPNMNDSNPVEFEVTAQPLPIGWQDLDIGAPGGSATFSSGTFAIKGVTNGTIGNAADEMHFVYQPLSGDGTIIARIESLQGNYSSQQVGVMIRETLAPGATNAFVFFRPNQAFLYYRATTGASTSSQATSFDASAYPYWVMLTRSGNTFSGYVSLDGMTWTQAVPSETISMAQTAYIGMAVNSSTVTASFDNVSVSSPAVPAPVITQISATTGAIGNQVVILGSGFGATQGSSAALLSDAPMTINSWSNTSITATVPLGATSGYVVVSVAPTMNDSNAIYFTVTTQPLPSGWLDQDIGGQGGSATYSSGVFVVKGVTNGAIGGTADAMHFVYQPLSGDGTIVARVANLQGNFPMAGVMIRETLAPGATNAFAYFTPNQAFLHYRPSTGANTSSLYTSFDTSAYPYWVKLTRSGNTFSGYVSLDGLTWTQAGTTETITMAENVYIGMAVNSSTITANFDDVSLSSTASPAPAITQISATTGGVGSQVVITGSGFGATQGNSAVLLTDSPMTINSWSDTSITASVPSGAISGYLVVSVAPGMNDSNAIYFTVTTQPLPSGWLDQDIGGTGGSATYSNGTFAVKGETNGTIGGTADTMHFVYQSLAGDGTIVARVANLQGANAQVGVMIRETLTSGSTHAFSLFIPNQAWLDYRPTTGASTINQATGFVASAYPYWVKVTRSGSTFSAYMSLDGVYWTQAGASQTITMAQNVYIGMAVNSNQVIASFDNVSASAGTPYPIPAVTAVSPTTAGLGYSVTVSGSSFGATQGTSGVYFNGTLATSITSWSSTQIVATVPSGATSGPVTVVENGVGSNQSVVLTIYNPVVSSVTPPAAPIGGQITVTGSGFGTAPGIGQVLFNGVATSAYPWSDTSITLHVPPGAASGPMTVTVGGVPSNATPFTVLEPGSITSISQNVGPVGTSVTFNGTGFGPTQSNSVAGFYGGTATVTSWSDTQIVVTVPSGASSGPVTVTVGNETFQGPWYTLSSMTTLTDSLGNPSTYIAEIIGGEWTQVSSQGSGCSSCSARGAIQMTYDSNGNMLTKTNELGAVTKYTYDSNNNVTSVAAPIAPDTYATTSYTYNNLGEVLTTTDPMGNVTTNSYNANGNLLSVTTPAPGSGASASVTQFTYNSLGELTQITDPLGNITSLTYNSVGLIATITDAQSNVTTYGYDSHGNRTSVTDALSHETTFGYDSMDRLTTITYPDTSTTTFAYDYRGRRTSVTDQNGKTTSYAYDDADRLTTVTDAASNVTTYAYDTENNLTSIQDANSHTTSFTYDAFGRVTQTTFPSSLSEYYYYDAVGNLISKTDRKNQTVTYTYDQLNRLMQKAYPDSTAVNYTYDNDSRLTQVTDPTGTYQFTFDNMGRLTQAVAQYSFLTGRNFTTAYTYDKASNRTGFTDPESGSTSYAYDTLNRLQTLTPPTAFSGGSSFGFSYDALSRRTQMTRPNSITTNYSYDNLSRLLSVLHQTGSTTLDGATYTLDSAGNRTAKTDKYANLTSNYTYDPIYELTQVTQATNTTESYTYDAVGNRTASLGVASYTTNSSNEMTANSNATYTYDNDGNTATEVNSSGTTTFAWDFENRLTSVTLPGSGGTVSFKYDPFGRRIYKSSSSATSVYAYDGDNLIEETNSSGTAVARYSQGLNIDEPLSMLRSSTTSYYDADGLGSITSLSNSAGSLAQTYTFDSFGKQTGSSGSLTNPFQYTARESDPETGFYYYRARYYDQTLGRFSSEDPARFGGSINFYRYVANSSVNRKDPFGLWQVTIGGGIGLGARLTFGSNNGQWNFGIASGVGTGFFADVDPMPTDGCHKFYAGGEITAHGGVGLGPYVGVDDSIPFDGPPNLDVHANVPGLGGLSWSPDKPLEPLHGFIGVGEGGFAGIGFRTYSVPPDRCDCRNE